MYTAGFIIWGWELIPPGCGGTSLHVGPRATILLRWLYEPQPMGDQWMGLGVPHRARRYLPGESFFSSAGCWIRRFIEVFQIWG